MFSPNQAKFLMVKKLKSTPMAFTLGGKAELEKIFSICPKLLTNKCSTLWPCIGPPRLEKGLPSTLGGTFATLGAKVSASIHILMSMVYHLLLVTVGPNNKPKNAQSWPQAFSALSPSVKRALVYHTY
jgi:hypothetical protein